MTGTEDHASSTSSGTSPAGAATGPSGAFGTVAAPFMVVSEAVDGVYSAPKAEATAEVAIHPFAHALHYGSACFEGLKAHRGVDDVVRLFRHERHVARMRRTAQLLHLPPPPAELLEQAIVMATAENLEVAPPSPGALYLRPLLLGTEPNIGAAAAPSATALLLVLASPVGDYFAAGAAALTLKLETSLPRTTPQFGEAKAGANYVMALGPTLAARAEHGAAQVLFAPDGVVQETGAANFLLLDDGRVVTPPLDSSFLHGVTRDSILQLARDLGYRVEERRLTVDELVRWPGEAALAGTAAVLAGVGRLITDDGPVTFGDGTAGPNTTRLREALVAIQRAERADAHGWLTEVPAER
ncbi:MAG: branched-chain-amino-acid transaminase [Nitriliruptoraceae bacterium]|nr:branched-chain-amino-acid transaminase [Nitriliruptoraceae bacterium]